MTLAYPMKQQWLAGVGDQYAAVSLASVSSCMVIVAPITADVVTKLVCVSKRSAGACVAVPRSSRVEGSIVYPDYPRAVSYTIFPQCTIVCTAPPKQYRTTHSC